MEWVSQFSLVCQAEDSPEECHAFSEPRITKKSAREAALASGWRFAEGKAYCPACWREIRKQRRAERTGE